MHTTVMDLNQTLITNQQCGQRTGMDGMNNHILQGYMCDYIVNDNIYKYKFRSQYYIN